MDAHQSLALIAEQDRHTHRSLELSPVPYCLCWGLTYLLGVGAVFLAHPKSFDLFPMPVALAALAVLIVASIVFSAVYGARRTRGIRGHSRNVGAMYGATWPVAFAALAVVNGRLDATFRLTVDQNVLLWTGTSLVLIGAMSMISGALWQERTMYVLGAVVLGAAVLSLLVGVPGNFLVLAVVIGGGFLAMAGHQAMRARRA